MDLYKKLYAIKWNYFYIILMTCATFMLFLMIVPLFLQVPFYTDWINHVWSINYMRDYLVKNADFPLFFNAKAAAGNPTPVFYGFLFYPLFAMISIFVSADASVRLSAAAFIVVHFIVYYKLLNRYIYSSASICLSVISVSSLYQISNLYNRSALTEFFSYESIAISIPLIFASIFGYAKIRTSLFVASLGLLVAAGGMHPPTAYSATVFVSPLLLIAIVTLVRSQRPRLRLVHVLATAAACCVMMPWVYIVVRYGSRLAINHDPSHVPGLIYFPTTIDSILGKLGWLYLDRRTLSDGIAATSTPFLNASLQVPLGLAVLVLVAVAWPSAPRSVRIGIILMMATCAITIGLSLRPVSSLLVPTSYTYSQVLPAGRFIIYDLVDSLQFAYRLSNTVSLQILIALLYVLPHIGRETLRARTPMTLLTGLVMLSLAGISLQDLGILTEFSFYRSNALTASPSPQVQANDAVLKMTWQQYVQQISNSDAYPDSFYSQSNYAMLDLFVTRDFAKDPAPWTLATFVGTQSNPLLTTNCTTRCLVQTNLIPSVFVVPTVDGKPVPHDETVSISDRLAFMTPAGTHSVGFQPVGTALFLFAITRWIGLAWVCGSVLYLGIAFTISHFRTGVPK